MAVAGEISVGIVGEDFGGFWDEDVSCRSIRSIRGAGLDCHGLVHSTGGIVHSHGFVEVFALAICGGAVHRGCCRSMSNAEDVEGAGNCPVS